MNNFCLPILKASQTEVWEMIRSAKTDYGFFEVWLDYVEDGDEAFMLALKNELESSLVVVLRRLPGEVLRMSFEDRCELLESLTGTQVVVDLDIYHQNQELTFVQEKKLNLRLITSYHNYQKTGSLTELQEITHSMQVYNPYIYKVATTCGREEDGLRLLELLLSLKKENKHFIVLGMGEAAIITRVMGPLWGNELVFAPRELSEQSAPGQITKERLEKILALLSHRVAAHNSDTNSLTL